MKIIFVILSFYSASFAAQYKAEIKDADSKSDKILYRIDLNSVEEKDNLRITAVTSNAQAPAKESVMEEVGLVNKTSGELLETSVVNNQTDEKGKVTVTDGRILLEYKEKGKDWAKKDLGKSENFVAPGNFESWLRTHIDELKKEKSKSVRFLVWERQELIGFKITYLGEVKLNGETTQMFKMNIDNFILAAFIDPIKIWFNQDMSQIRRYLGRVAPKKLEADGQYSTLDADVKYTY